MTSHWDQQVLRLTRRFRNINVKGEMSGLIQTRWNHHIQGISSGADGKRLISETSIQDEGADATYQISSPGSTPAEKE
eukprot:CAMPEP_0184681900 /NCGR_PEP_ID=MMETSP0312-20130426/4889_1 /TAXON_ID=31354 /ORGANISM="Compsopogon coeruleus, Strain SAG 36.94" /LENGTH=77 /DNA_ID=CAMNT_0027133035 /DNA_START=746 /DNA_END=979 /DNA_ORIENTATION=-